MKKVLMIAYHFPPLSGSSGIQRTLRFVQHLPSMGWQPLVISADPRAYERTSADLMADVPVDTVVRRPFALDTARHLRIAGHYLAWMARPDRWVSWKFAAVHEGLKLIKEFRPNVIWSTFPIATAHVIAATLHRRTGIPWVADFRDPMAQESSPDVAGKRRIYPRDPLTWQMYRDIEAEAAMNASLCVFTTPGAANLYKGRYPSSADHMVVLENGYDEESFAAVACQNPNSQIAQPNLRPLLLLHSGIVYPGERDPTQLFIALGRLQSAGALSPADLRIRFRASEHDDVVKGLAHTHGALSFIEVCPAIPYREALGEMMAADVLLVLQASNCNIQIPAKIYEYLRAGKPILGLTDPIGDTAGVMRAAGLNRIARLDSADEISAELLSLLRDWRFGKLVHPLTTAVQQASRRERSKVLASLLTRAAGVGASDPASR